MDKCLVYHPYHRDARAGGPSGFISQNFDTLTSDVFHVTPNPDPLSSTFITDFGKAYFTQHLLAR